jgi:hypothetical protein
MSDFAYTISLRIRHPSLDPDSITQALGLEPQHAWRAGDARRDSAGEALEGAYRESYWVGRLAQGAGTAGQSSAEGALLNALAQLDRTRSFLEQLSAQGGHAELHVSLLAQENFRLDLSAPSLNLLARLGLAVVLEVQTNSPRDLATILEH